MGKVWLVLLLLLTVAALVVFERDHPIREVDPKYTNSASQFLVLADATRVHYRDQGNPQGQPLVLLHGSNASLHTWEPWVAELGDTYRIVTLDLPGHGLTGRTPSHDYSGAAYRKVVAAVTQHLGLATFVLGGNSMGGGVTWRYALAHPEQVSAMVLVSASGFPAWRAQRQAESGEEQNAAPLAFRLLRQPWFQSVARYIDPHYLVVQGLKASHWDADLVDDALIARYYDLSIRAGTREATLKRFANLREQPEQRVDPSKLRQPTLVLWGEQDQVIPMSTAERFGDALPQAQVIVYPQVGHIAMEEIPKRSAADVRRFLQEASL